MRPAEPYSGVGHKAGDMIVESAQMAAWFAEYPGLPG
ncbi:hypothetical protein MY11210_000626 [Beauveria gryllotalpidicola]